LLCFAACFLVAFPSDDCAEVQIGLQQGFSSAFGRLGGNLLGFFTILLVSISKAGCPGLVFPLVGVPQIAVLGTMCGFSDSAEGVDAEPVARR